MYLSLERYSRPRTIEEALRLASDEAGPGRRAALLAGGTDLNARAEDHAAVTHVIDLQALPLDGIALDPAVPEAPGGAVRIGARVTLAQLRRDERLAGPWLAALREAARGYAVIALQNRATLGGRIASDRSDQDLPPALLALGARLRHARLAGGAVVEEVIDYPTGAARAALTGALITEVILPGGDPRAASPTGPAPAASALRRFGRTAVDVPLATCAVARRGAEVRIAANLQGPAAADLRRLPAAESLAAAWLERRPPTWRRQARAALLDELVAWADPWAGAAYRRDLTATLAVRALAAVLGEPEIQ